MSIGAPEKYSLQGGICYVSTTHKLFYKSLTVVSSVPKKSVPCIDVFYKEVSLYTVVIMLKSKKKGNKAFIALFLL